MSSATASVTPTTYMAGTANPIELPFQNERLETFGKRIAQGDEGAIYEVKESNPPRVYKAIPYNQFKNGNEIRISRIASLMGIAPTYHSAFVVEERSKYVVIEMDRSGKTLGDYLEEFAPPLAPAPERAEEKAMDPKLKAFLEKLRADQKYQVVEIKRPNRVSIEEALERLYEKPEDFYFHLFSRIRHFAERCISYGDTHVGNIIPLQNKTIQLIDFGGAKLMESVDQAKADAAQSAYNVVLMMKYRELPDLSDESLALIDWFYKS